MTPDAWPERLALYQSRALRLCCSQYLARNRENYVIGVICHPDTGAIKGHTSGIKAGGKVPSTVQSSTLTPTQANSTSLFIGFFPTIHNEKGRVSRLELNSRRATFVNPAVRIALARVSASHAYLCSPFCRK